MLISFQNEFKSLYQNQKDEQIYKMTFEKRYSEHRKYILNTYSHCIELLISQHLTNIKQLSSINPIIKNQKQFKTINIMKN